MQLSFVSRDEIQNPRLTYVFRCVDDNALQYEYVHIVISCLLSLTHESPHLESISYIIKVLYLRGLIYMEYGCSC